MDIKGFIVVGVIIAILTPWVYFTFKSIYVACNCFIKVLGCYKPERLWAKVVPFSMFYASNLTDEGEVLTGKLKKNLLIFLMVGVLPLILVSAIKLVNS